MLRHGVGRLRLWALILASLVEVSIAGADPKTGRSQSTSGYSYDFPDDPLDAGGFGPNDARIPVHQRRWRVTLIRSRTDFIPELLKAVESL